MPSIINQWHKDDTGLQPSSMNPFLSNSQMELLGTKANRNYALLLEDSTSKLSLDSKDQSVLRLLRERSLKMAITNSRDLMRLKHTCIKKQLVSRAANLNLERSPLNETRRLTGMQSRRQLSKATSTPYQVNNLLILGDIFIRYYGNLTRIFADHATAQPIVRTCQVYWGPTGTGKSRRAWDEAGFTAYAKDPRTKWWCGYRGQENVVIDEFRGSIDIAHLLRWLDRYPVCVEIKGASRPLIASKIWITSNVDPRLWYPDCDPDTVLALLRRLEITHFNINL